MANIQLTDNGPRFELPHNVLMEIAGDIASNVAYHNDLFRALLDLNIPSITEALAARVDADDISIEEADRLWQQGMFEARKSLLNDRTFLQRLSKEQMEDILRLDDNRLLAIVAEYFDFDEDEDDDGDHRLDQADIDRLLAFLAAKQDLKIRKALMENDKLDPEKFPVTLEQRIALDVIRGEDYEELRVQDVELFRKADSEVLDTLSYNLDEIRDSKARKAFAQMLIDLPDPQYRQEMAIRYHQPKDVLKLIAKCNDPIAADYARKELEDRD